MTQFTDREHNASHSAENPRNEASLASGNTTVEESGRGERIELPFKESTSQKGKLQFLQPRRGEAKKVILSQSYLRLACTKRGMGPTAKATEIVEPAIPADLRYNRKMTHFELQNSAKAALLAENFLLGNLKRKTNTVQTQTANPSHSLTCIGTRWISPHQ